LLYDVSQFDFVFKILQLLSPLPFYPVALYLFYILSVSGCRGTTPCRIIKLVPYCRCMHRYLQWLSSDWLILSPTVSNRGAREIINKNSFFPLRRLTESGMAGNQYLLTITLKIKFKSATISY